MARGYSLARVPLFRSLDPAAIEDLEKACSWRRFGAGEWVISDRSADTDCYFITHGTARVIVSISGRETILNDLREGDCFGEIAAIDGLPRSASVRALTDVVLASIPAARYRQVIYSHPEVCLQVLNELTLRLRQLIQRANEHSGLTAKHRLWGDLLRLARPAAAPPHAAVISPPPTHAELAARIGWTREAVTRELSMLTAQGMITRRTGAIVLVNASQLRTMWEEAAHEG